MVIFLIYFYSMHLWISTLAYQIESAAFSLFIFLPLLPGIPIAAWYLMEKGSPSLLNHTQQLLRTGAGHDELMVRELEKQKSNCSESNNSG
ncbi:MAG: hypothetical protein B0W54_04540 [Cellvibrio sp. 79]|nr:MAG: hypothetical protein B0W54_04540 [Cellvibrio sp. 79]